MAGLCAPLSTLRRCPRGHLRMTRGRCGSLLLHRDGLAPSTPNALKFYDYAMAPSPRRVRIFIAEKGLSNVNLDGDIEAYPIRLPSLQSFSLKFCESWI